MSVFDYHIDEGVDENSLSAVINDRCKRLYECLLFFATVFAEAFSYSVSGVLLLS